jgi:ribonuclease BN (tRNA processing enzyme)
MLKLLIAGAIASAGLALGAAQAQPAPAPPSNANEIVLLGTNGGPSANAVRSEPASLLIIGGRPYLIDAGDGTPRQLAAAGQPVTSIRTVFITHHHLDHTAGLEPLIALSWAGTGLSGRTPPPVEVYGPPATSFLVKAAINYISVSERVFRAGIPSLPDAAGMFVGHDIDHDGLAYQDDRVKVTAVENTHFGHHPSLGPDGKRDMSFAYRFDTPKGSIVFTGDTGPSEAVTRLAKGADVLVSEVFMTGGGTARPAPATPLAKELGEHMSQEHLSPEEVGKMATAAGVKTLILTHLVIGSSPDAAQRLEDEVKKSFSGTVIVGHDLLKFEL